VGTFCRAALNYVSFDLQTVVTRDEEILDGRAASLPGWDEAGFELVDHPSSVTDWSDDEEISAVHHAEVEILAEQLTGCDHALVAGHIKRGPDQARQHQDLAPITFVHSDFAPSYLELIRGSFRNADDNPGGAAALARHGLTREAVEGASRIVILQLWRNLGPAKMDHPIAFCDARTVGVDDARAFPVKDYAGSGFDFEALGVRPSREGQRYDWYVFPELEPREAVVFRTFDTDLVRAGKTFFTPHSAFRDPDVALGKPARRSIELRATCIYA
jgi:hypothetical protein